MGCRSGRGARPPSPGTSERPDRTSAVWVPRTASTDATTQNPIQNVLCGSSTPSAPPNTQASCSTVSERPNAEARDSSGRSRWITASRHTLASALPVAPTSPTTAAVRMPGNTAATAAAAQAAATQPSTMTSGLRKCSREPIPLPRNEPAPAAAPTMPIRNSCRPASPSACCLTTNATNRVRKPVSTRDPLLPHNATSTDLPTGRRLARLVLRSRAGTSPAVISTHFGIRALSTAPATPSAAVK